jgi:hypothetical protein
MPSLFGVSIHSFSSVPMNIDFTLHRNGEWTMLMLGESVFSILIVDIPNETSEFYATFYCSLLAIILMQYLHFRSQPRHADHHAMRRSKNAGMLWSLFQSAYSFALVSLGAAFTIFLTVLGIADIDEADTLKERSAHLFSGSLATIFFCLDCMTILHLGIEESQDRCVCKATKKKNSKGMFLLVLRIGLIVFCATLSQWLTEPDNLAEIGVACVLCQLFLRKLGGMYLSQNKVHAEADAAWPNVTHARADQSEEHS